MVELDAAMSFCIVTKVLKFGLQLRCFLFTRPQLWLQLHLSAILRNCSFIAFFFTSVISVFLFKMFYFNFEKLLVLHLFYHYYLQKWIFIWMI